MTLVQAMVQTRNKNPTIPHIKTLAIFLTWFPLSFHVHEEEPTDKTDTYQHEV